MATTASVDCWLNVTQRRKCERALAALTGQAGRPIAWDTPEYDAERRLYHVTGEFEPAGTRPADAVLDLLVMLNRVTNHCVVSGPRFAPDGGWEFYASAEGRQVDVAVVRSLTVVLAGAVRPL